MIYCTHRTKILMLTSEGGISGYFCSDAVFNLSHKKLTETEIKVFEKGLR